MWIEYVNGNLSWFGAINRLMAIFNVGNEAFQFFQNFFSNLVTAFTSMNGGNVWSVVAMVPDFLFMLAGLVPATRVISQAYNIAMLV